MKFIKRVPIAVDDIAGIVAILDMHEDAGPIDEGYKSPELTALIGRLKAAVREAQEEVVAE